MINYFSNKKVYNPAFRYQTNNISKAFWNNLSVEERRQVYGDWVDRYQYHADITQTDICILTYQWPYYINNNKVDEAASEVKTAQAHGKPLVIFSGSDYPANLPFEDVILFESAGYRSTLGLRYHSAQPTYIPDYLKIYCDDELQLRPKGIEPVIGFCGLASRSIFQTVYRNLLLKKQQQQYRKGYLKWEPPPYETSTFRSSVLRKFENQPGIKTNYLLRRRYRAGIMHDKSLYNPTKVAFVNNILDSDYTVCVRGGGNFSVRFYETICLGRIPIFIDTDCLLPFQDEIDYKAYFPWIDVADLPHATEIIREFHANLSDDDFIGLQKACRQLWLEHMTPEGFHRDFVAKMQKIITKSNTSL